MTVSLSLANLTWAGYFSSLTAQVNIQTKSWTTVKTNPTGLEEDRQTITETGACVSMVLAAVLGHFCMIPMRAVRAWLDREGTFSPGWDTETRPVFHTVAPLLDHTGSLPGKLFQDSRKVMSAYLSDHEHSLNLLSSALFFSCPSDLWGSHWRSLSKLNSWLQTLSDWLLSLNTKDYLCPPVMFKISPLISQLRK